MLDNLSFSKRLWCVFSVILTLILIISGISIYSLIELENLSNIHSQAITCKHMITQKEIDHLKWVNQLNQFFIDENSKEITVQTDDHKCSLGKWMDSEDRKKAEEQFPELKVILTSMDKHHEALHNSANTIKDLCGKNRENIDNAKQVIYTKTYPALKDVQADIKTITDIISKEEATLNEKKEELFTNTKYSITTATITVFILGLTLSYLINKYSSKQLNIISVLLKNTSQEVVHISEQVASASNTLAQGSTEQAANLEETNSSLEEISAMTNANTETTEKAVTLTQNVNTSVKKGYDEMQIMMEAILKIQSSSEQTANINKVIDEIAFQTNLLALNAAVEAARAGEAGKGFAVVAEEVRNLAMRSAEAAKNTSDLIKESVQHANTGVSITEQVNHSLEEIAKGIEYTTELISQIASAGKEQTHGISTINASVSEIADITQTNAANAEETSSASKQLEEQSIIMNEIINDFMTFIHGNKYKAAKSEFKYSDQIFHNISDQRLEKEFPLKV